MNKVLGWGTVVYLLVMGFAISQHALVALVPARKQFALENAKTERDSQLGPLPAPLSARGRWRRRMRC